MRAALATLLFACLLAACGQAPETVQPATQAEPPAQASEAPAVPAGVSRFGEYEGFSTEHYQEWVNSSRYVEMSDGVKLAVDVTFPAVDGKAASGRFPVVWTHTRYRRNPKDMVAYFPEAGAELPDISSQVDAKPALQRLVRHGYIVVAVQVRGGGASFGRYEGLYSKAETRDAYEIMDWLVAQPWCDGNLGMYGNSYLGTTQYMAASTGHPALKAIFPMAAVFDLYDVLYPGGVFRRNMIEHWGAFTDYLDFEVPDNPVDGDTDGSMMRAALAQHQENWDAVKEFSASNVRDYQVPSLSWEDIGVVGVLPQLLQAKVPSYHWNGWFDAFVLDTILFYQNYTGPQKMSIGPWPHGGTPDMNLMMEWGKLTAIEQHRWFDYWLKGIDNGIMDEAPINFAIMNEPGTWTWASADRWPPAGTSSETLYLSGGSSREDSSINDGLLLPAPPPGDGLSDTYAVDLTTTTGANSRWDNSSAGSFDMIYPDLAVNDRKSMTYTTPPLEHEVTVRGHPVVTLYVNSTTRDGDFIVLLEEVDGAGHSHYVTEGVLRASRRALGDAPWDNMGLPFQRSFQSDVQLLPEDRPGELVMDLHPTANVFNLGHRIRLRIMGADADNIELTQVAPTIRVQRNSAYASRIDLPVTAGSLKQK